MTIASQVLAMVPAYYAAYDAVSDSRTLDLDSLYSVATTPWVESLLATVQQLRGQGYLSMGSSRIVFAKVASVDTTFKPTANPPIRPHAEVTTCIDESGATTTKNGKPYTPPGPPFFEDHLTFTNYRYPDATGWRVSHYTNQELSKCPAS